MASPGAQAALFIVSTAVSIKQSQDAASARRRAAEQREQVQKQRNFRRKQQELRRARAARAQQIAQGEASGVGLGSSPIQGVTSSTQAQAASNVSFLDNLNRAGGEITDAQMDAQGAQQNANIFGEIAGSTQQIGTIFEEVDN